MTPWLLIAASLYAGQLLPFLPRRDAREVLDVFHAGVRIDVPITLVNNCDWPQTAQLVFRDDQNRVTRGSITAAGKGTATQTTSVTPRLPDLADDPPFALLDVSAFHGEHIQNGKVCLASNPKFFLEADDALPRGARHAPRSVTAKTFTITLDQKIAPPPPTKVVPTTPNAPASPPTTPGKPNPPAKAPPTTTSRAVAGMGGLVDIFRIPDGDLVLPPPPKTMEELREEILGKEDPWTYEQLDRDREEEQQRQILKQRELEAEASDVMEPDPIALLSRAGRVLLAWLRRPADSARTLAAASTPLDSRIARVRGSSGEQVRPQDVSVAFIATGEASGQAFTVKVLNRTGKRVRITLSDGLVLAPAGAFLPARAVNARGTSSHPVIGYCLEHAKQTPSAGAIFAVAPASVQQRYKGITNVVRSGRLLDRFKRLSPQGDEESYGHSVQQWALWTKLEGWNYERFASKFVERTRKNIAETKGKWNKDVEKTARESAVARWADISKILRVGELIDAHENELRRK